MISNTFLQNNPNIRRIPNNINNLPITLIKLLLKHNNKLLHKTQIIRSDHFLICNWSQILNIVDRQGNKAISFQAELRFLTRFADYCVPEWWELWHWGESGSVFDFMGEGSVGNWGGGGKGEGEFLGEEFQDCLCWDYWELLSEVDLLLF